ncbi:hypothetical protein Vadar_020084 [Vaccinium darrowii]|uniref:Uncharacterized protein n=1 Tax=Vaccinium darrowii TaxID=229202 RepID=A0ACB7XTD4_9ERIC|nr:hypothetical protein Vadar_020084 [Vaccinium darrowii]
MEDLQIRYLGGSSILITGKSLSAVETILNVDLAWASKYFYSLERWNGQILPPTRCVWLNCFGVPLNVWVAQTFHNIGKLWGDVLALDVYTIKGMAFDRGRIFVATEKFDHINEVIQLEVNGKLIPIRVSKDSYNSVNMEHVDSVLKSSLHGMAPEFYKPPFVFSDDVEVNNGKEFGTKLVAETPNVSVVSEVDNLADNSQAKDDAICDLVDNDSIEESDYDDSLVGESKEEIDSFEDIATVRQLDLSKSKESSNPYVGNCTLASDDGDFVPDIDKVILGPDRALGEFDEGDPDVEKVADTVEGANDDGIPLDHHVANRLSPVKAATKVDRKRSIEDMS